MGHSALSRTDGLPTPAAAAAGPEDPRLQAILAEVRGRMAADPAGAVAQASDILALAAEVVALLGASGAAQRARASALPQWAAAWGRLLDLHPILAAIADATLSESGPARARAASALEALARGTPSLGETAQSVLRAAWQARPKTRDARIDAEVALGELLYRVPDAALEQFAALSTLRGWFWARAHPAAAARVAQFRRATAGTPAP